jgi:branched-chain amino acid transport system permease protein
LSEETGVQQDLSYALGDDFITRTYVLPLLADPETRQRLIEEHRRNPVGTPGRAGRPAIGHSPDLARVVDKFRRQPMEGKYVMVCRRQFEEYYIGVCSGVRGEPVRILQDRVFTSEEEVEHAIFLKRIDEFLAQYAEE